MNKLHDCEKKFHISQTFEILKKSVNMKFTKIKYAGIFFQGMDIFLRVLSF